MIDWLLELGIKLKAYDLMEPQAPSVAIPRKSIFSSSFIDSFKNWWVWVLNILGLSLVSLLIVMFVLIPYSRPKNIRVTNLGSNSVSISWVTDKATPGVVTYGLKENLLPSVLARINNEVAYDDRDVEASRMAAVEDLEVGDELDYESLYSLKLTESGRYYLHHVTIVGLDSETEYYFQVGNGVLFRAAESDFANDQFTASNTNSFTTFAEVDSVQMPDPTYGKVLDKDDVELKDGVAFMKVAPGSDSLPFSSVLNEDGNWYVDISTVRAENGFIINHLDESIDNSLVYIEAGDNGVSDLMLVPMNEDAPAVDIIVEQEAEDEESVESKDINKAISQVSASESTLEDLPDNAKYSYSWMKCVSYNSEGECSSKCKFHKYTYEVDGDINGADIFADECVDLVVGEEIYVNPVQEVRVSSSSSSTCNGYSWGDYWPVRAAGGVCPDADSCPCSCPGGAIVQAGQKCPDYSGDVEVPDGCNGYGNGNVYWPVKEAGGTCPTADSCPCICPDGDIVEAGQKCSESSAPDPNSLVCSDDSSCSDGWSCENGVCVNDEDEEEEEDSDPISTYSCPSGFVETSGENPSRDGCFQYEYTWCCPEDSSTDPGNSETPEIADECDSSGDCNSGWSCVDGVCIDPEGSVCSSGYYQLPENVCKGRVATGDYPGADCKQVGSIWCYRQNDVCSSGYYQLPENVCKGRVATGDYPGADCKQVGSIWCYYQDEVNVTTCPAGTTRTNESDCKAKIATGDYPGASCEDIGNNVWCYRPAEETAPTCPYNYYPAQKQADCKFSARDDQECYLFRDYWYCKKNKSVDIPEEDEPEVPEVPEVTEVSGLVCTLYCNSSLGKPCSGGGVCKSYLNFFGIRICTCGAVPVVPVEPDDPDETTTTTTTTTTTRTIRTTTTSTTVMTPTSTTISPWFPPLEPIRPAQNNESDKRETVSLMNVASAQDQTLTDSYTIGTEGLVFTPEEDGIYNIVIPGVGTVENAVIRSDCPTVFYVDENGNGEAEDEELIDLGSTVDIEVYKETSIFSYDLGRGYNFVSFPFINEYIDSYEFLQNMNYVDDAYITSISRFRSGQFEITQYREDLDQVYGDRFPIVPGWGYIVRSYGDVTVDITGQEVAAPVGFQFANPGWHLIGVHGSNQTYTAETLLDSIDKVDGLDADNVTKWEVDRAKYEGLQKEAGESGQLEVYGLDFEINNKWSYFVRIAEGNGLWVPD